LGELDNDDDNHSAMSAVSFDDESWTTCQPRPVQINNIRTTDTGHQMIKRIIGIKALQRIIISQVSRSLHRKRVSDRRLLETW
jgi:hypothetical protein